MNTAQLRLLEELCLDDHQCVLDVIDDEAYADENELVELKDRLTLLDSIFVQLTAMR